VKVKRAWSENRGKRKRERTTSAPHRKHELWRLGSPDSDLASFGRTRFICKMVQQNQQWRNQTFKMVGPRWPRVFQRKSSEGIKTNKLDRTSQGNVGSDWLQVELVRKWKLRAMEIKPY
jgi:hypothetical protein